MISFIYFWPLLIELKFEFSAWPQVGQYFVTYLFNIESCDINKWLSHHKNKVLVIVPMGPIWCVSPSSVLWFICIFRPLLLTILFFFSKINFKTNSISWKMLVIAAGFYTALFHSILLRQSAPVSANKTNYTCFWPKSRTGYVNTKCDTKCESIFVNRTFTARSCHWESYFFIIAFMNIRVIVFE